MARHLEPAPPAHAPELRLSSVLHVTDRVSTATGPTLASQPAPAPGAAREAGPNPRFLRSFSTLALLALALLTLLAACQPAAPQVDHLEAAKTLAAKIAATPAGDDLSHPMYEQVAQELALVPEGSAQKLEADAWLKKIQDARRAKLFELKDQDGGSMVAERKKSGSSRQARSSSSGKGRGGAPEGWLPDQNVDVAAITASVRGGSSAGSGSSPKSSSSGTKSRASSSGLSVTVYSASWCGVCKAAKSYLTQQGIPYTNRDIERDPGAKSEMVAKAGPSAGIPVIDVNGSIMVGFDKSALDGMIRKAQ